MVYNNKNTFNSNNYRITCKIWKIILIIQDKNYFI